MRGVGGDFVEVDDAVELVGGADPFIDCLTYLFPSGRLILCADEGGECGSEDLDAVSVGPCCELAESRDEVFGGDYVVGFVGVGGVADVIDAFHNNEVFHSGLSDDIAIETSEGGGACRVVENAVAADSFVKDGEIGSFFVGLEATGENIGPTSVGIASAECPVGDAVAEGDNGGAFGGDSDVEALKERPAVDFFG